MPTLKLLKHKHTKLFQPYDKENQSQMYYDSKLWRELRKVYKIEHPLCEECLSKGIVKPAVHIHHKIEFLKGSNEAERWNLLLDPNNLQALCLECHHKKHEHRN